MDQNSNPKRLALLSSILISTVFWIAVSLFWIFKVEFAWLLPIGVIITIPILYFIFYRILETFIYRKVKLIYKTIHNKKRGQTDSKERMVMKGDVIGNVSQEVKEWAESQQDEIDELRRMAQYRREFLGNVSHELKTPIFNIQGYILTLLDGGIDDKNVNKLYLERSEKSVNRMIAIIDDLEKISSLESGAIDLSQTSFDIIALAGDVCEFMEIKAEGLQIDLKIVEESAEKELAVNADKEQIRQVLINLVDNAIKYMGSKKDSFIHIHFFDLDENILVEVEDNGMGIADENLPRLFERFFRVDKGRSRDKGGTGLGLAIVKHIIEAHDQTIHVRSKVGVGTTFGFTLKKSN